MRMRGITPAEMKVLLDTIETMSVNDWADIAETSGADSNQCPTRMFEIGAIQFNTVWHRTELGEQLNDFDTTCFELAHLAFVNEGRTWENARRVLRSELVKNNAHTCGEPYCALRKRFNNQLVIHALRWIETEENNADRTPRPIEECDA